jgi:tripartite-type tricarboxylate transporter receptor subunit TctC
MRTFLKGVAAAALLAAVCTVPAFGQTAATWPSKPITLVLGQSAGGNTDSVLRIVTQRLESKFNYHLVILNQPGASGSVAAGAVTRSMPDGYTFLVGGSADQVMAPALLDKLGFDPVKDFVPVAFMAQDFVVMAASGKAGVNDWNGVKQLITNEKRPIAIANSGNGTTGHLAAVNLEELIGVKFNHIPYKGAPGAIVDTIGGRTELIFGSPVTLGKHFPAGDLRPIAFASDARMASYKNIPTFKELGIPLTIDTRYFILAKTGTPPDVVKKFGDAIRDVVSEPEIAARLIALGVQGETGTPEQLSAALERDRTKWGEFIRTRGIRPN